MRLSMHSPVLCKNWARLRKPKRLRPILRSSRWPIAYKSAAQTTKITKRKPASTRLYRARITRHTDISFTQHGKLTAQSNLATSVNILTCMSLVFRAIHSLGTQCFAGRAMYSRSTRYDATICCFRADWTQGQDAIRRPTTHVNLC